jgi:hypothetical protein
MAAATQEPGDYSSLINVKSFKEYLLNGLSGEDISKKKHEPTHSELAEAMEVSVETVAELDEVCRYVEHCAPFSKLIFLEI